MARRTLSSADQRYFLERHAPTRLKLIRWLAEGKTQQWCADQLGASQTGVRDFAKRYKERIAKVAADFENDFAGIEFVEKKERIEAYVQTIIDCDKEIHRILNADRIIDLSEEGAETGGTEDKSDALARLERTRHRAIRSISEELGQLPSRMALVIEEGIKLRHEIVGIDPKEV